MSSVSVTRFCCVKILLICFSFVFSSEIYEQEIVSPPPPPPHSHYTSVMQQPLLTNQMQTLSAHQPINIGIAHVVWPQPANKRNRHAHNR